MNYNLIILLNLITNFPSKSVSNFNPVELLFGFNILSRKFSLCEGAFEGPNKNTFVFASLPTKILIFL